jgi:lysine decarboxylase
MASVDGALAMLGAHGEELAGAMLRRVRAARDELRRVPGLVLPDSTSFPRAADGTVRFDDAKLVTLTAGTGADGIAVDLDLEADGITLEMADRDLLIPMVTMVDSDEAVAELAAAMAAALEKRRATPRPVAAHAAWVVSAEQAMTPREAFFASREPVPWAEAPGRVCAEVVAPYPPGVPVLAPGERITQAALDALREARDDGARIAYAADPSLETVLVVDGTVRGSP